MSQASYYLCLTGTVLRHVIVHGIRYFVKVFTEIKSPKNITCTKSGDFVQQSGDFVQQFEITYASTNSQALWYVFFWVV